MPVTDPIADMLNRIRNANIARKEQTEIPYSKIKEQMAGILKKEGFIRDFQIIREGPQGFLRIFLRYGLHRDKAITGLKRISRPGLRVYVGRDEIPRVSGGIALVILSTNRGVMTDRKARELKVGGEVMCYVW